MSFQFSGDIHGSKSKINRALVLSALHPWFHPSYVSEAEDVLDMKRCFLDFQNKKNEFYLGSGGTSFRFFAFFISTFSGRWVLNMAKELFARPHEDLILILKQIGVRSYFENQSFIIESQSWKNFNVEIDFLKSSQFFTGFLLASTKFNSSKTIKCLNRKQSSSYERVSLDLLEKMNIAFEDQGDVVFIPGFDSKAEKKNISYEVGADWSSVFSLLCFCFSGSACEIKNVDMTSSEPDKNLLQILIDLGLKLQFKEEKVFTALKASPSSLQLKTNSFDLQKNPDAFPHLSILLIIDSLVNKNINEIIYPLQLKYKESDRLNAILELLNELSFKYENTANNKYGVLKFYPSLVDRSKNLKLNSYKDHRLVMAYELLKSFGFLVEFEQNFFVNKSFPQFFEVLNG